MKNLILLLMMPILCFGQIRIKENKTYISNDTLFSKKTKLPINGLVYKYNFENSYKNGRYSGFSKQWYNKKQIEKKSTYKNRIYEIKVWYENGQLSNESISFSCNEDYIIRGQSVPILYNSWYENGQQAYQMTYDSVSKKKSIKEWYENGQLKSNYISLNTGDFCSSDYGDRYKRIVFLDTKFYENGQQAYQMTYDSISKKESIKEWYENGQLKKDGLSTWYENGQLKKDGLSTWYENGQLKKDGLSTWYENGQLKNDGLLTFKHLALKDYNSVRKWYENGQICYKEEKINDSITLFKHYNPDASLKWYEKYSFDLMIECSYKKQENPEFVGGMQKLYEYLGKNIQYPEMAKENGIQGKVFVQFVVWNDGTLKNIKVVKGVHKTLDDEAIRVFESIQKWSPAWCFNEANSISKVCNKTLTIPVKF